MSAADSIRIGPLTADWQNAWELCKTKYEADGIPMFEKFCRTLNFEADITNTADVEWSRTSIGNNPAGRLGAGESIFRNTGGYLQNENLYTLYVRGNGQYLLIERQQ